MRRIWRDIEPENLRSGYAEDQERAYEAHVSAKPLFVPDPLPGYRGMWVLPLTITLQDDMGHITIIDATTIAE